MRTAPLLFAVVMALAWAGTPAWARAPRTNAARAITPGGPAGSKPAIPARSSGAGKTVDPVPPPPPSPPAPAPGVRAPGNDGHAGTTLPPDAAPVVARTGPRLAVDDFKVEGDDVPPALVLQLLDGFVLGLVRHGLQVVDPDDARRRLSAVPELAGCDTSPCLKRKGQLLGVSFVARVKVDVVGNTYKMSMRTFRTEGAAPAALPVDTRSRFCDVCTITEAREVMIRLADGIDLPREEPVAAVPTPPPPPPPRSRLAPVLGIVAGVVAIGAGAIVLSGSARDAKVTHALMGSLMGAGAFGTTLSLYLLLDRSIEPRSSPGVPIGLAVGGKF